MLTFASRKETKTMGYTHYFAFVNKEGKKDTKINKSKFAAASAIVKELAKTAEGMKIKLAGPDGKGKPIFTRKEIAFNGVGDEMCESFYMDADGRFMEEYVYGTPFCKTCREPYDLLVCLTLLAFKHVFKDRFDYSSDGTTREDMTDPESIAYWKSINWTPKIDDDWQTAYDIWEQSPFAKK